MNFNHLFDDKELRLANKNSKCLSVIGCQHPKGKQVQPKT